VIDPRFAFTGIPEPEIANANAAEKIDPSVCEVIDFRPQPLYFKTLGVVKDHRNCTTPLGL